MNTSTDNKSSTLNFVVVVPAAGVGKRMQTHCPKQYLMLDGKTILEHTVLRLLSFPRINKVILVLSPEDEYFVGTSLNNHPDVQTVNGGQERVDSVLAGLQAIDFKQYPWVLVHDAARPCVSHTDINALIETCLIENVGGLLASPVRDTMKRSFDSLDNSNQMNISNKVKETVERSTLWHALTPQMFKSETLKQAIESAQKNNINITDESSAMEHLQQPSLLVEGSSDNIKITRPDDFTFAEFILAKQAKTKQQYQQKQKQEQR